MPAITLTPAACREAPTSRSPTSTARPSSTAPVRVTVKAPTVRLLGKSGTAYVVGTANAQGGHGRIYRVAADGTRTLLAKAHPY